MMGTPNPLDNKKTPNKSTQNGQESPAIPSDFEDIQMSPIGAFSVGAGSTDFGSTPTKSYAGEVFSRTPQGGVITLEAPSSRLRHSINIKKAISIQSENAKQVDNNLSFDMGDVEMLASSNENLNQISSTPFSKTGQANYVTLKEQEKIMNEIKKENFDLKLRVSLLQERLSRSSPDNIEGALAENVDIKVKNETLMAENRTYKNLVNEAHGIVEQLRMEQAQRRQESTDVSEIVTLRAELDQSRGSLMKAQVSIQRYESQLILFDKESRENAQKMKKLELEIQSTNNRLIDANNCIGRYKTEIIQLEEELRCKCDSFKNLKEEISASTSDVSLFTRQMQELQDRLKRSEEEKEELLKEKDRYRKGLEKAETHLRINATLSPSGSSSPARNSLDVLESKLLKELGNAHRRVNDLEKQTNLSHGERDQLISQARRTGQDLMIGIKSMQLLAGKIVEVAFPGKNISNEGVESLEQAVEQVETLCREVLIELDDSRLTIKDLDSQFIRVKENLLDSNKEMDHLTNSLSSAEVQIQKLSIDLNAKGSEIRTVSETNRSLQNRIRELSEVEIPKWQRESERANEKIKQLGHFVENYESTLKQSQQENEDITKKFAEAQQFSVKIQNEISEIREYANKLQNHRDELIERLASQESLVNSSQKRLEELQSRVGHSEKVKSAVEDQFNKELKSLHIANGELKGQLSVALSARTELTQRVDRLSQLLRESERGQDEIVDKGRSAEAQLSALRREHEILALEHKTFENELQEKQMTISSLEKEISRIRREDNSNRRNQEGLEILQAKVESISAINSFFKEQIETRERTIRSLEERLRHQQEEMRRSREEVDAQSKKLKKREILIGQALKRLENINHLKQQFQGLNNNNNNNGNGNGNNNASAFNPNLEFTPFRDDHHPSLLTPTKPQNKNKRTNSNLEEF